MQFDMRSLSEPERYKIMTATITPRPIAWVTSRSRSGVINAAPFSFFNMMGSDPPTVTLGLLRDPVKGFKDTASNILDTGEFVVHLVTRKMAEAMNITCIDAPAEVSEIELAGLATRPASVVAPPLIEGCPVAFECRNLSAVVTGPRQTIVIGEVLVAHIDDACILDAKRRHIDNAALDLVARLHGAGWYVRGGERFQLERPTWAQWQAGHD